MPLVLGYLYPSVLRLPRLYGLVLVLNLELEHTQRLTLCGCLFFFQLNNPASGFFSLLGQCFGKLYTLDEPSPCICYLNFQWHSPDKDMKLDADFLKQSLHIISEVGLTVLLIFKRLVLPNPTTF